MRSALLCLIAGAFIAAIPAYAHHSFAATYDERKSITLDATVSEFLFRNPHCLFSLDAKDDQGNIVKWSAEWGGAGRVGPQGVTATTFQPGDHVVITGSPGLVASDHRIHLKTIVRPADGLKFENPQYGRRRR